MPGWARTALCLAGLLAALGVLSVPYHLSAPALYVPNDAYLYADAARHVARGDGLTTSTGWPIWPVVGARPGPHGWHLPGTQQAVHIYLLAGVFRIFGPSLRVMTVWGLLLSGVALAALFFLAKALVGRVAGFLGCWLLLLTCWPLEWGARGMTEPLYFGLLCAYLLLLLHAGNAPAKHLLCGVLIGVLLLTHRYGAFFAVGVVSGLMVVKEYRSLRNLGLQAIGVVGTMAGAKVLLPSGDPGCGFPPTPHPVLPYLLLYDVYPHSANDWLYRLTPLSMADVASNTRGIAIKILRFTSKTYLHLHEAIPFVGFLGAGLACQPTDTDATRRSGRRLLGVIVVVEVVLLVAIDVVGATGYGRYLQPAISLAAIWAGAGAVALARRCCTNHARGLVAITVLATAIMVPTVIEKAAFGRSRLGTDFRSHRPAQGLFLAEHTRPSDLCLVSGFCPRLAAWYADRIIIDDAFLLKESGRAARIIEAVPETKAVMVARPEAPVDPEVLAENLAYIREHFPITTAYEDVEITATLYRRR